MHPLRVLFVGRGGFLSFVGLIVFENL